MPTRRQFIRAAGALAGAAAIPAGIASADTSPDQPFASPLLRPHWNGITSAHQWPPVRQTLLQTIERHLGQPTALRPARGGMKILTETTEDAYRHLKIAYQSEEAEEVRAHLLIPPPSRRRKGAAVLCLHGTSPEAKDTQLGAGEKPGRDYGRLLAQHGFITLSPDHCCSGERLPPNVEPYDSAPFYARHPDWSMVGKAIFDGRRALDILQQVDEVDASRLGTVGHSLGGHGAVFVAAFDPRVRAAVCSCGLTTWSNNPQVIKWARDAWYVYFPHLKPYIRQHKPLPFDLYEFVALAAPRAVLNISGMSDPTYGPNDPLPGALHNLQQLYTLLDAPAHFANYLPGMGHDVPHHSRILTLAWLENFLVDAA